MAPSRGTERQAVRIARDLWDAFGAALPSGVDRSTALRAFMRWYLREPGAKLPERPSRPRKAAERPAEPPTDSGPSAQS